MLKKRSDALETGDVIRCKAFRWAFWSPESPDIAQIRITKESISTRDDCGRKAAGDPARSKRWYEVVELRQDGSNLYVQAKALSESGARDDWGEVIEFTVPGGGIMFFRYHGKMSNDGTQIVYTIPTARTS